MENPNNPISAIALFEKLHKKSLYFLCKKYKVRFCTCVYLRGAAEINQISTFTVSMPSAVTVRRMGLLWGRSTAWLRP